MEVSESIRQRRQEQSAEEHQISRTDIDIADRTLKMRRGLEIIPFGIKPERIMAGALQQNHCQEDQHTASCSRKNRTAPDS